MDHGAGRLHRDGTLRLARNVPAWLQFCVGEKAAGTRDIFLWMKRVNLVFRFVPFVRNREDTNAMNGRGGGAECGNCDANVKPGEVDGIDDGSEDKENRNQAHEKAHGGRSLGLRSHGYSMGEYFALHGVV